MSQAVTAPLAERAATHGDGVMSAILDAATRVFSREGRGANMAAVAAEAGVGRATLYRHVRSRDELVAALQRRAVQRVADALDLARHEAASPGESLDRLIGVMLAGSEEFAFLASEAQHVDEGEIRLALVERMSEPIERCRAAGLVRDDVSILWQLRTLASLCQNAALQAPEESPRDWQLLVRESFLDGMRGRT